MGKSATPVPAHTEADIRHIVPGLAQRGVQPLALKASISRRVERGIPEWCKAQGPGDQTRTVSAGTHDVGAHESDSA